MCLGGSLISFIEIFYFFSLKLYASYQGMAETPDPDVDNHRKHNEINVFKISSIPTDDTQTMRLKSRNQSKVIAYQSIRHDRYLD